MQPSVPVSACVLAAVGPAPVQAGDATDPAGTVQTDPPASMVIAAAPVRTPTEELATFVGAPGYPTGLVAGEPPVQGLAAVRFGAHGRMWGVEMRGQMPTADGDGVMDRRTDSLDRLAMPRAVLRDRWVELRVLAPSGSLEVGRRIDRGPGAWVTGSESTRSPARSSMSAGCLPRG